MQPKLLKYILDIECIIEEIESIQQKTHNGYPIFSDDIILQRVVEAGFTDYRRSGTENDGDQPDPLNYRF